ncbi:hypothetical protein AK812_SmicGene24149 [Symbiodinium microadriaticum]|uniref:Uncharacterized protein n=1 Tax=Symbiodinium microadriaticum TaxID=2951 RepID=A0A1Q9DFH0_SYMMI|nr:hypothetical protein AK812_SmicGene24149 [Symbiodinium microadriaticum]
MHAASAVAGAIWAFATSKAVEAPAFTRGLGQCSPSTRDGFDLEGGRASEPDVGRAAAVEEVAEQRRSMKKASLEPGALGGELIGSLLVKSNLCPSSEAGGGGRRFQVNVLSVVEALGRLDLKESLLSAASAALCERAQRLDESYQVLWKPPGWSAALGDPSDSDKGFALRLWLQRHFGQSGSSPIVYDEGSSKPSSERRARHMDWCIGWTAALTDLETFAARQAKNRGFGFLGANGYRRCLLTFNFSGLGQVCKEYLCIGQGWLPLSSGPLHLKAPLKEEIAIDGERLPQLPLPGPWGGPAGGVGPRLQLARSRVDPFSGKLAHTEAKEPSGGLAMSSGPIGPSRRFPKQFFSVVRTGKLTRS